MLNAAVNWGFQPLNLPFLWQTGAPVKYNVTCYTLPDNIPSNSFSRVHECDRYTEMDRPHLSQNSQLAVSLSAMPPNNTFLNTFLIASMQYKMTL